MSVIVCLEVSVERTLLDVSKVNLFRSRCLKSSDLRGQFSAHVFEGISDFFVNLIINRGQMPRQK